MSNNPAHMGASNAAPRYEEGDVVIDAERLLDLEERAKEMIEEEGLETFANASRPLGAGNPNSAFAKHAAERLAQNYKLTPATLYSRIDKKWIPENFLLQASLKIAQTIAKPNGRLIISWPPRHGKSRLATIATPIWILENFPHLNIILATYGADLSTDFGREVRDLFESNQHLLDERIRPDVKSVGRFMTTKGGGMLSVGLGGAITGKGANVFLIDDYIKTMAEALSKGKRNADWEWFTGTAYHRLEPDASMIIIATRWHKDDLIGRIIKEFGVVSAENPTGWDYIKFHAIAMANDPLGRKVGEPLFEARYDADQLADRKRVLGTLFFNAIFQQEPEDDASKLTDRNWIEIVDHLPPNNQVLEFARIWDFGGGKGKESDPSVGTLLAVDKVTRLAWVVDIKRGRWSPETTEAEVLRVAEADGIDTAVYIEQEPGASGLQLVSHYTNNILPEYTVEGCPASKSKVVRAQPFLAACEAGKVKLLKRSWNETWLDEFEDFPDGSNDDQVDTCAIGYNKLLGKKHQSPTWGRKVPNAATDAPTTAKANVSVTGSTWGRRRNG